MFSSSDEEDLGDFLGALKLDFHEHLVYPTNISYKCRVCGKGNVNGESSESEESSECSESNTGGGESSENDESGESGYICKDCVAINNPDLLRYVSKYYAEINNIYRHFYVHKDCVEINNPYRHKHPLKLLEFDFNREGFGKRCLLCGRNVECQPFYHLCEHEMLERWLFYHCFLCDFTLCILCSKVPLFIDDVPKKVHEHSLTQVMIKVSFTCDACGVCGDGLPCVCLLCCFIIHRDCIKLPRVIHVNRHDHRVSHAYSLGIGDWVCGVCRKGIDRVYGAYSCSKCPYAVHSKCATRPDVWDGVELEDVPEDDEDLDPFEKIGEGLIRHFLHEHDLRLIIEKDGKVSYCYACSLPIYCDPCYACIQCRFVLHEECANLPKKLRHELQSHQLTLCVDTEPGKYRSDRFFVCTACRRSCTGFCYEYERTRIDVRCARVSKTFNHGSHPHPLFSISTEPKTCKCCRESDKPVMSCVECDFDLCFYCATLPKEVRHKYDRHPLSLCYGENAKGLYWCEICERETNPNEWFYTCNECGSTFHINCVLGDKLHVRPGHSFICLGNDIEVVANDHATRPFCSLGRCVHPFVFKMKDNNNPRYGCMSRWS